jgi:hypothetical protein
VSDQADVRPPDGIAGEHYREARGVSAYVSAVGLAILLVVVLAATLGFLGRPDRARSAGGPTADLEVFGPELIRNGEFFEMRFTVTAHEPMDEMALAIDASLWEDFTVNTMIPAPSEEEHEDGRFRFTFGPMQPGDVLLFKVDLQINPDFLGSNAGQVQVLDGDEAVVALRYEVGVLP